MWLLDVKSYVLVDVVNSTDVRYATLSHTWASEEVSFADIQNLRCAKKRLGWHKIEQSCHLAAQRGIDYVWIDTCCIDKSSSAELSEAINSMFAWYKDSHECYVHLSDLDPSDDLETALPKCRWFTRGWTLQELIAPKELLFYDNQWNFRGKKASMTKLLSQITNVDEKILLVPELLSLVSVGKRMSWAAKRQTTRLEDMAYCLFGIFGVNMPLIYGEGTNAFLRLQEAVALATEDLSLFAWTGTSADEGFPYSGILAHSPSQFAACRLLEKIDDPLESDSRSFTVVNRNVGFQACLRTDTNHGDYLMRLHCKDAGDRQDRTVVIRLVKTPGGFVRHSTDNVFYGELHHDVQDLESWDPVPRAVTISKRLSTVDLRSIQQRFSESFHFKVAAEGFYYKLTASMPELADETHSSTHWDSSTSRFLTEGHPLFTGLLTCTLYNLRGAFLCQFLLFFGFSGYQKKPWLALSGDWETPMEPNATNVYDLPKEVGSERHRMNYLRFSSYAGRFFRAEINRDQETDAHVDHVMKEGRREMGGKGENGKKGEGSKAKSARKQLREQLVYTEPRVKISVALTTRDAGDYTNHRVLVTCESPKSAFVENPTSLGRRFVVEKPVISNGAAVSGGSVIDERRAAAQAPAGTAALDTPAGRHVTQARSPPRVSVADFSAESGNGGRAPSQIIERPLSQFPVATPGSPLNPSLRRVSSDAAFFGINPNGTKKSASVLGVSPSRSVGGLSPIDTGRRRDFQYPSQGVSTIAPNGAAGAERRPPSYYVSGFSPEYPTSIARPRQTVSYDLRPEGSVIIPNRTAGTVYRPPKPPSQYSDTRPAIYGTSASPQSYPPPPVAENTNGTGKPAVTRQASVASLDNKRPRMSQPVVVTNANRLNDPGNGQQRGVLDEDGLYGPYHLSAARQMSNRLSVSKSKSTASLR